MDYKKAYDEAKANGYSDQEIAQHLSGDDSKYQEAIKSGYSDSDIISHFVGSSVETTAPEPSAMDTVLTAAKNAFVKPINAIKEFATNPQQQANTLPVLLGAAGGVVGPGGATLGATAGEALKQLASRALGNPNVPQTSTDAAAKLLKTAASTAVLEGAGAALGKGAQLLTAGRRIGEAEKAAGVVTKAADKYPTSGTVGETLNNLEAQLQAGTISTPQEIQQAKDVIDFIWRNPKIVGKTNAITVQAARVAQQIQKAYNAAVPGRAAAAADFNTLMKIKNAASTVGKGAGVLAGGAATLAAIRAFLHR